MSWTFLRQYDFLSQIVDYDDPALEKLSIYLRHLAPTITREQLGHEIDLSTVDFEYIAQHEQGTTSGKLAGGVPLEPAKEAGTGTVRDPEMVALEDVIAQINDLFSGDHPDSASAAWLPTSRTGSKRARRSSSRRRTTRWPSSPPAPTCRASS